MNLRNLAIVSNITLAIAVAILYVLHFKGQNETAMPPMVSASGSGNLVYVNIDTLLENYTLYQKKKVEFETAQKSFEADMEGKKAQLQANYDAAQSKARAGNMTEAQMQAEEEKLMQQQQQLMDYKTGVEEKMAQQNVEFNKSLYNQLNAYLREMNKTGRYQFILGYTQEGGILLANDSLNITKYVLEGLNKKYAEEAAK